YRPGRHGEVEEAAAAVRAAFEDQMRRYARGEPVDRAELDGLLERVGAGPLGQALADVLDASGVRRLIWAPDTALHGLPIDAERPLAAYLCLPSGEAVHALEWLDEPVRGLRLVTLSACWAAQVAPVAGGEVFGLVSGLLGGGARAVVAGLWPVADEEAPPL